MTTPIDPLYRVASVGPYFAVEPAACGAAWLPLRRLLDDADAVSERVAFVRGALAARAGVAVAQIEARAAASIHFLGLASRLVAPPLAAAAVAGVVPRFGVADVWWQRVDGGPVPIAITATESTPVGGAGAAAAELADGVVRGVVGPLVEAFADGAGISRIVLWGNVASAQAGAAAMLLRADEPLTLDPVAIVTELLHRDGPLAGAGRFGAPGRFFVRSSCCLFYRIPHAGKCGDCVLL